MLFDSALTVIGLLLLAGALSCKLSSHFNLPVLLLFLAAGAAAEWFLPVSGEHFISPINQFSVIAMAYILYSGGLETDVKAVRKVMKRGIVLACPGVAMTALLTGLGAYMILGRTHTVLWCLLLGALISSTDAAAVFAILRGRSVSLHGNIQPLLEFESGSNDPMAALLTLMFCTLCAGTGGNADSELLWALPKVLYQLGGGVLCGMLAGWAGKYLFRIRLDFEGLYFVMSVAWVLLCYGVSQLLKTNGFMACYVCGLCMNNASYSYKRGLVKFHNAVGWLMQVGLFILLGFLAQPEKICDPSVWGPGIVLGLMLMFVARPIAVFICLAASSYSFREKLFISWVGIRGAAPVVLATFPLALGIEDAAFMFRLIFFMVILSIVIQGWTLMPVAKLLKIARPAAASRERPPLELEIMHHNCEQEMHEFEVTAESGIAGKSLAELGLPSGLLVTMIRHDGKFVPARGNSVIAAGDGVLVMGSRSLLLEMEEKYFKN